MASVPSTVLLPPGFSRRTALSRIGWIAAGLAVSGCTSPSSPPMEQKVNSNEPKGPPHGVDDKIFTCALTLEFMEAEYYTRGAYGHGLSEHGIDVGRNP